MDAAAHHARFLERAVALARENVTLGGGPFAALVVDAAGAVLAEGANRVTLDNDPTAHAEVVAIRAACAILRGYQLPACVVYCSCEPCPMCLGAIYWARPAAVYFAATSAQAAAANFDDSFIYREIPLAPASRAIPMHHIATPGSNLPFEDWLRHPARKPY